jgi:hypothetical protein
VPATGQVVSEQFDSEMITGGEQKSCISEQPVGLLPNGKSRAVKTIEPWQEPAGDFALVAESADITLNTSSNGPAFVPALPPCKSAVSSESSERSQLVRL